MNRVINFFKIVVSLSLISSFGVGADFELNKILDDAKKINKQTMLFLHKDNCNFCDNMVFNLEDKNVSSTIEKNFILVDINRDDDETISFQDYEGTNREFLKKVGIDLYPTVLFIDNNSTLVYDVVGYRNKETFINILNYIGSKSYINETFEEFEDELLTDDDDW